MMTTHFSFGDLLAPSSDTSVTVLIGRNKDVLQSLNLPNVLGLSALDPETVSTMLESVSSPSSATTVSTFVKSHQLHLCALPDRVSRNNHPWSVHSVTDVLSKTLATSSKTKNGRLIFCGADVAEHTGALASAVAKAFPVYTQKTSSPTATTKLPGDGSGGEPATMRTIHVSFLDAQGASVLRTLTKDETDSKNIIQSLQAVCAGVQLAARLVDTPPEELTTDAYAAECCRIAEELKDVVATTARVSLEEIVGVELKDRGYGGLYGVGKAATCPPRLLILEYTPPTYDETIALVGKGIVYDTGGLSLKSKDGMPGMKHDMGGSAGLLGGFMAAVQLAVPKHLVLILCLAENAIGPTAFRNDDILRLYSGQTVEINNTDAEGRLVLADGVAHATKHIDHLDLVIDMATLTGAQLVATGKMHAGILANGAELEQRAVAAGLSSGDLVFPLLYAPELLRKEFDSKVADMKNSVKDRGNAQTSCAGHFIEAHLNENYKGGWLHVDMAGPSAKDERGLGYGVGLVLSLLKAPGF